MRHLMLLVILSAILLPARSTITAQEDELAPYLYYYSSHYNAFVIERADGTDSRLFGPGLAAPDHNYPLGPVWSPSGEWFAWTTRVTDGLDQTPPIVLSVDGIRRLTSVDLFPATRIRWAPDADLLLVYDSDGTRAFAAVIDATTDTVVASVEQPLPPDVDGISNIPITARWTAQGALVSMAYGGGILAFWLLGLDGAQRLPDLEGVINGYNYQQPPSGDLIYEAGGYIRVLHPLTGTQQAFFWLPPELAHIEWDPSGKRALLLGREASSFDQCPVYSLWLYSDTLLSLVRSAVMCQAYWSPSGAQVLFLEQDGHLYTLDPLAPLPEPAPVIDTNTLEEFHWWWGWRWLNEDEILLREMDDDGGVLVLNIHSGETRLRLPGYLIPDFSRDGLYAAFPYRSPLIYNTLTHTETRLLPDSRSHFSQDPGAIHWHPEQPWMILFDKGVSVANADGSIHRELDLLEWGTSIDWLPQQVDPDALPPAQSLPTPPTPARILNGTHIGYRLNWSPDGRQIMLGWEYYAPQHATTVWNVDTGVAYDIPEATWGVEVNWILDASGGYVATMGETLNLTLDHEWWRQRAVSPDGHQIVTQTRVYNADTGEPLRNFVDNALTLPLGASYSPDGGLLAITVPRDQPRNLQIWDTQTWELVASPPIYGTAVAFSPDGTQLAIARSWNIEIYDVADLLR
jgi:WD40 repeat protein